MNKGQESKMGDSLDRTGRDDAGGYVAPTIQTYSPEEFLDVLGPAQGYGGGSTGGNERPSGRGFRLFPGLR